jgi:hypothetical protein
LFALACAACAAPPTPAVPSPSTTPSPVVESTPAPSPSLTPASPAIVPPAVQIEPPAVTVTSTSFPTTTSLALQTVVIDAAAEATVRASIDRYLMLLNAARDAGATQMGLGGKFGEAVAAGIAASATPGVKRKFELSSFRVERLLKKPWGTNALAEVTATIVDKTVEGSGPDQWETGRLRLLGDRLFVSDGWDAANGRWFNGIGPIGPDEMRSGIGQTIGWLLRVESWVPGSAVETSFGVGGDTPYLKARHDYLGKLDRMAMPSRTFANVSATIERYETFQEIRDGLATVRVTGDVLTTDKSGQSRRQLFERRLIVMFGNWGPEIVDEEIVPGTWMSGGDLALGVRDHTFA